MMGMCNTLLHHRQQPRKATPRTIHNKTTAKIQINQLTEMTETVHKVPLEVITLATIKTEQYLIALRVAYVNIVLILRKPVYVVHVLIGEPT
jgi:hypothetical protein